MKDEAANDITAKAFLVTPLENKKLIATWCGKKDKGKADEQEVLSRTKFVVS